REVGMYGDNGRGEDPQRPPDWRWGRAVERAETRGGSFRPCRDPYVVAAQRYREAWGRCRGAAGRQRLTTRFPALDQAFRVYADPGDPYRHAVEARVLAGQPPADIADRTGLPAVVVLAYEAVFFDVRSRLRYPDYVLHRVIGPRLQAAGASD